MHDDDGNVLIAALYLDQYASYVVVMPKQLLYILGKMPLRNEYLLGAEQQHGESAAWGQ